MPNPDFRVCTNRCIPLKNINQTALLKSGQTELFTHFLAKSQCPGHIQKKIQRIDKNSGTIIPDGRVDH